jgi:hypothetical protein
VQPFENRLEVRRDAASFVAANLPAGPVQ